jgi:hypothetical protein
VRHREEISTVRCAPSRGDLHGSLRAIAFAGVALRHWCIPFSYQPLQNNYGFA